METARSRTQGTPKVEQKSKKAYHSPALRVCGTVKQHTQAGTGPLVDTTTVWASTSPS